MNAAAFVASLLGALSRLDDIQEVTTRAEGPIVSGRAFISNNLFLAFYYNEMNDTQAFALVKAAKRIWGIDFDHVRGWHLHPLDAPYTHIPVEPQSVEAIIIQLGLVLANPLI